MNTYSVKDIQTGTLSGTYQTLRRAAAAANKRDLAYGACRFVAVNN